MNKEQFVENFCLFLQSLNLNSDISNLETTTNLMESGYLDSLSMVEVIIFIENMIGEEISIENYQLSNFYTIEDIYNTFINNEKVNI